MRVAVIGLGLIGRQRAEALASIEGATLSATVDPLRPDPAATARVPHYSTVAELPSDSYDAAIISVPHDLAPPIAASVLRHGRAILIEKPLGVSGAEARQLEALAAGLSMPSFVGYNYRFLPAIDELWRRVEAGDLGALRHVEMFVGHGGHPDSATGWKLDPKRAGGGVLLDPGVHLLDLLRRLVPTARCVGVEATRGFWQTGIEEDVALLFRAERLIATLRSSHIRWVNTFRVEVFGDDGYAIAEGRGGNYGPMTLRVGRRWAWADANVAGQRESEELKDYGSHNDSLRDELADVISRWRGEQPPSGGAQPATMSEARMVAELCDELYTRLA
jgi:1,5-anhydro-D-fructose reductase (1,5-anhydro-D-mannitol-forming)